MTTQLGKLATSGQRRRHIQSRAEAPAPTQRSAWPWNLGARKVQTEIIGWNRFPSEESSTSHAAGDARGHSARWRHRSCRGPRCQSLIDLLGVLSRSTKFWAGWDQHHASYYLKIVLLYLAPGRFLLWIAFVSVVGMVHGPHDGPPRLTPRSSRTCSWY